MWMINYPFPYQRAPVAKGFAALSHAVARAVAHGRDALPQVVAAQNQLEKVIQPKDFRYLDFQLWQEGVARYTELRVAELGSTDYQPGIAFSNLPDYRPYAGEAARIRQHIVHDLDQPNLLARKRVAVYSLGAGMALALDRSEPGWRSSYLSERFRLSQSVRNAAMSLQK